MIGKNATSAPIVIQEDPRVELAPGEQLEVGTPTPLMLQLASAGLLRLTGEYETPADKRAVAESMKTLLTEFERY